MKKPKGPSYSGSAEETNATIQEGRAHYHVGFKIYENPYPADTVKKAAWRLGWLKGRDGK